MPRNRLAWADWWPDLLAALFFAVLFLPYPLTDHFPGNCDAILGMALVDGYVAAIRELFTGIPSGSVMWPDNVHHLGETMPLVGFTVAAVRAVGLSWAWTSYFMYVLVFAANVWAIRRCVAALTGDTVAGIVAGFGFSFANILWAHIDDLIVVIWVIPALVTWLILRAESEGKRRLLLIAGILGAAQAYVAMYVFVFQSVWLGAWCAGRFLRADKRGRRSLLVALALYIGLAMPLVIYHASARRSVVPDVTQISWTSVHAATGLRPSDLVSTLPGNIVHDAEAITDTPMSPYWSNVRRRVSFGWLWILVAVLAFADRRAPRMALGITAGFGLLFAVGWGSLGGPSWPPPSTLLVNLVPWLRYLRIVSRAHLLVLFAASIAVGFTVAHARRITPARPLAAGLAVFLMLHALENMPIPLPGFAALPMQAPAPLVASLANMPNAVVLHLPADNAIYMNGGSEALFPYNRELLYMLWQPQYGSNTVNGLSGYLTPNRLMLDALVKQLPSPDVVVSLRQLGVTHIAYHPDLTLNAMEQRYTALASDPNLIPVTQTPELTIWRLVSVSDSK